MLVKLVRQRQVDVPLYAYLGVEFIHKLVPYHVQQLIDECQLQNLLINDGKDQFQIVLHLPLEDGILVVVLMLGCLLLEQDVFDEDVEHVHVGLSEGFLPEDCSSCCEDAHIVEHFFFLLLIYILIIKTF